MSNTVPPIPYKSSVVNSSGMLSDPWSKWFRELFSRIGGSIAPSNADISDLQSSVTSISASISALQVQVNDLNVGPYL